MKTDQPLSILILINGFHPKIGGSEKQAEILGKKLIEKGCKVKILTLKFDPSLKNFEEINGIPVERIEYPKIPLLGTVIYLSKLFRYLYRTRKEWDSYYVVIVEYFAFAASVVGKLFKKPVILKFTGVGDYGAGYIKKRKLSGLLEWGIKKADIFVAVSKEMISDIAGHGFNSNKIKYMPNGVDCSLFKPPTDQECTVLRKKLDIDNVFTVVFTGRFVPVKEIPTLLKAWKQFMDYGPKAQLLLIGDGPLFQEMKTVARELDIKNQTFFMGRQSNIHQLYRAADMGIISSKSEGLSNVLLEMMACGVLVAATNIKGNTLLLEDKKNGLLFEPGDSATLSRILYDVYTKQEEKKAMVQSARQKILDEYSIDVLAKDYIELFSIIRENKIKNG